MDPVLSSLFPINKIGNDGFSWWIGQVEDIKDPKKGGRVRVRIVGEHLRDCNVVPSDSLPWAHTMMPVTTPYSDNGDTGASSNLNVGNWVIGFYLDNDKQKPIVMGSIPHTPGSTKVVGNDPNPGGDCKSLTRYIGEANPATNFPEKDKGPTASANNEAGYEQGAVTTGAQPAASQRAGEAGGLPPSVAGAFKKNSETNPTGGQLCVVVANPSCGAEKNLKSNLTHIIGEMLAANQESNGQLGDFLVSKANGELNNHLSTGRYHIGRVTRLVRSSIARVKGEVITELRNGVDQVVETLLYERERPIVPDDIDQELTAEQRELVQEGSDALSQALQTGDPASIDAANQGFAQILEQVTGQRGHPTIKPRESRLKGIQDFFDKAVKDLGCSFKDITERIADFITDLLLGLLEEAYHAATCLIDQVVNAILSQILGLIDSAINAILGPLQSILGTIASIGNMVGAAIKKVTDFLGLCCTGPEAQCEKIQVTCTDCTNKQEDEDDLDKLIKAVEDGDLDENQRVCREATEYPPSPANNVVFIGGVLTPTTTPSGTGGSGGGPGIATGFIQYNSSDLTVTEGNQAIFTITRSGFIGEASSLNITHTPGTASSPGDYVIAPVSAVGFGTITFAPGETSKEIRFDTISDTVSEPVPEEFTITITPNVVPVGYIAVFPSGSTFTCRIVDAVSPAAAAAAPVVVAPPAAGAPPLGAVVLPAAVPGALVLPASATALSYSVTPDKFFVDEGDSVTFTINTTGVPDGVVLNYTITGVDAADIVGGNLTGSFTIVSGTATVVVGIETNIDNPSGSDPSEVLIFSVDTTPATTSVTINATASTAPSFNITTDKSLYTEGEVIQYTINTTNVPNGTVYTYTLSGSTITASDIVGGSLTGSFTVNSNVATFSIGTVSDSSIEGAEVLTFTIDTVGTSRDVIISDAPLPVVPAALVPTYAVSSDKLTYTEGENIIYTITTTNVADGSSFTYQLFGSGITPSDFVLGSLGGTFTVYGNTATVVVAIANDTTFENNETLTFSIYGTSAFADVVILGDTTTTSLPTTPGFTPCTSSPAATAITNASGAIISVALTSSGCSYVVPPRVIIGGQGYGAAAIPVLDNNGFLSEIRLTRTGKGYTKNLPGPQTKCIVTSFTMLRPGSGYTSAPTVYVDGDDTIAEAVVEDGFVTAINILDRTMAFDTIPPIRIVGGGGFGAKFLPNLSCLDNVELERKGYALTGTGRYIDCP